MTLQGICPDLRLLANLQAKSDHQQEFSKILVGAWANLPCTVDKRSQTTSSIGGSSVAGISGSKKAGSLGGAGAGVGAAALGGVFGAAFGGVTGARCPNRSFLPVVSG